MVFWGVGGEVTQSCLVAEGQQEPWPGRAKQQRLEPGSDGLGWRKAERWVEPPQASVADALDALFNTYIKRVIISKSVSYANEWQLHLEEHPTV